MFQNLISQRGEKASTLLDRSSRPLAPLKRRARLFEAQAASKCTLALISCEHVIRLLAGLPVDALISILAALNTFWSENLRFFTILLNLPHWDRLTMVLSDLAKRA